MNQALVTGCIYGAILVAMRPPCRGRQKQETYYQTSCGCSFIIYDDKKNRATGVRVIDGNTREMIEFYSKIIFVMRQHS